jgi:SAM-dependent methyltransferase
MTVLELGAGTCWVSLMLNKFGCRTIAVDVSPTGLDLGRRAFEADRLTNWTLDPQFLSYDGRHLPIGDAAVDAIVLFDAFHHLPNPRQLLGEMHRVLARDGVVGMSEPGRGHAESQPSQSESAETGVLEDELFVEHVAQLAIDAGFRSARRVVGGHRPLLEIDLRASGAFMGGRHFATYWDGLCSALESHYLIVLYKDEAAATTSARPRRLIAHLSSSVASLHASVGITANLEVRARNVGDTTWLASSGAPGWTRLGIHLYQAAPRRVVDYDWVRVALPSDITPGDTATMTCSLPALVAPGDYLVVADLVIEGVTWFADRESAALTVPLRVR